MDTISCSSSTLIVKRGCCCCCSMQPLLWCACALLRAAIKALDKDGWPWSKGPGVVGSLFSATLKQSSRALHWRGCEVWWGCDLRQALLKRLVLELSKVAATCKGVTWAWPLLLAKLRECFNTEAASVVRVCWTVQAPERITWLKPTPHATPFERNLCIVRTKLLSVLCFSYVFLSPLHHPEYLSFLQVLML